MLQSLLSFCLLAVTTAFNIAASRPAIVSRSSAPMAMVGPEAVTAVLPTTTMVADDSLVLASGGLIFAFIPLAVVAVVVINFGIMKK